MTTKEYQRLHGCTIVLRTRLDALFLAITKRDWLQTEWEFDRVRAAAATLASSIAEEPPTS